MKFLLLLIMLLTVASLSMAESGYRRDPWGSKTWVGSGRPPHWSAQQLDDAPEMKYLIKKRKDHHERLDRFEKIFHENRKAHPIIRYRQETQEPEVVEKTVIETRQIPVQVRPSPIRCGGDTVYLKNKTTGELIIRYVSPTQDC